MEKDTSEIAKLTERIAKDPKSKLFVPLAEEHKKAGDLEMAIYVLKEGLRYNPGYVTARSFLGRLLMDKGDLNGAQKELEEVIKAIPDNLLAQRKLGDLYVLQGRGGDALQRYRAAFALNPADKELPLLLADLEAGKDVSARIPQPKVPAAPAAPRATPAAAAPQPSAPAAPQAAPAAASPQPLAPAAPQTAPSAAAPQPTAPAAPKAAPVAAAPQPTEPAASRAAPAAAAPQPKEVPLPETAKPAATTPSVPPVLQKAPASAPDVANTGSAPAEARPVPPAPPVPPAHDEAEVIEDIVEIEALEQPVPEPEIKAPAVENAAMQQSEPAGLAAETAEIPSFDLSEAPAKASTDTEDLTAGAWGRDTFTPPEESRPAETVSGTDEGSDDLNTDTLAELYISQGFYEKAIEIYQGMLEERPENQGLRQKLEKLRAMAGTADSGVERFATHIQRMEEPAPAVSNVIEETPPPVEGSTDVLRAVKETPEASEPSPLVTTPEMTVTEPVPDSPDVRTSQAATMRRKETIDRLESWLKNIMKEKES